MIEVFMKYLDFYLLPFEWISYFEAFWKVRMKEFLVFFSLTNEPKNRTYKIDECN